MTLPTDDISALRRHLRQLRELHEAGALDAAAYDTSRAALERRLLDQVMADTTPGVLPEPAAPEPAALPVPAPRRPAGRLLAGLALLVLVGAGAGYWFTGSPSALGGAALGALAPEGAASGGQAHATGAEQIAAMVDSLSARLKAQPNDAEGWAMLARSLAVLGRHAEALPAYAQAVALRGDDASLLADQADALAVSQQGRLDGEPMKLVDRALKLEPQHVKALSLAGTAAFDRQDYAAAVKHWEALLKAAPADSPYVEAARANVAEARELGKLPPAAVSAAVPAGAASTAAPPATLTGTVTLAPALAAQANPDDTLFVYARPAAGSRMPLAMLRKQVRDLPLQFKLDDSLAMSPAARLSGATTVIVGARISKSGQAVPQPGDLSGQSAAVAVGSSGLSIAIAEVVPR